MSYQPMPSAPAAGPPPERGAAPSTVRNAVTLMLVRAGLGIVGVIVLFATKSSLKKTIRDKNLGKSTTDINNLVNAAVIAGAVIAIIFIVLYVLLALQVRKGKNWARIVTWVFAGLGVLSFLASLAQSETGASRALAVVDVLLDVALIILLAMKPSNEYFRKLPPQGYGQYPAQYPGQQGGPPPGGYPPPGQYGPPPGGYPTPGQYGSAPGQGGQYGPPPGQYPPPQS